MNELNSKRATNKKQQVNKRVRTLTTKPHVIWLCHSNTAQQANSRSQNHETSDAFETHQTNQQSNHTAINPSMKQPGYKATVAP